MAAKPESVFIRSVNKHLTTVYHEKTNNPFRGGIADVWYSGTRGDLWVEYKYRPSLPRTKPYVPDLSPIQVMWLGNRYDEGRNVAVILGLPEGGIIYRDLEWVKPRTRDDLIARTVTRQELAQWIYGQVGDSPCRTLSRMSQMQQR